MIAVGAIHDRHGGRGSPPATPRGDTGGATPQDGPQDAIALQKAQTQHLNHEPQTAWNTLLINWL